MHKVVFDSAVVESGELSLLDQATLRRVLTDLATQPEHYKPLRGPLKGHCTYRVDNLRVVFSFDPRDASKPVIIVAVGNRRESEVYATAEGRV